MMRKIFALIPAMFAAALAVAQCNGGHSTNAADAWLSCDGATNPNPARSQQHWIQYDFGGNYLLGESVVWNYNVPGATDQGLQDVTIDYSYDGATWTEWGTFVLNEAPGSDSYMGDIGPFFDGIDCRYLLVSIDSNYGGTCYGLSELKIDVEPGSANIAEPEVAALTFGLYPNPTRERVTVQLEDYQGATIRILDLSGALIDIARPESATTHFDLSRLPAGMYLVQVTLESGGHATRRVAVVD